MESLGVELLNVTLQAEAPERRHPPLCFSLGLFGHFHLDEFLPQLFVLLLRLRALLLHLFQLVAWSSCCVTDPASGASAAGSCSPTAACSLPTLSTSVSIFSPLVLSVFCRWNWMSSACKHPPKPRPAPPPLLSPPRPPSSPGLLPFSADKGDALPANRRCGGSPLRQAGPRAAAAAAAAAESVGSSPAASALLAPATSASAPSGWTAAPARLSGSLSLPSAELKLSLAPMARLFPAGRGDVELPGCLGARLVGPSWAVAGEGARCCLRLPALLSADAVDADGGSAAPLAAGFILCSTGINSTNPGCDVLSTIHIVHLHTSKVPTGAEL
ncbi:hypothetical protein EYF80_042361 [Liparis tanakae]|uniref:Uncharacterized protein n=1 Tax=Liparis tanakae TaxID=230148 RepID=A0A4Z2G1J7_9TELE|nr:hypothetical protein EYF80_042361 [Liparis tanakae]